MAKNTIEIAITASNQASGALRAVGMSAEQLADAMEKTAAQISAGGAAYDANVAKANQLKLATLELARTQVELANETDALKRAQLEVRADKLKGEIEELNSATESGAAKTKKFGMSLTDLKSGIDMAVGAFNQLKQAGQVVVDLAMVGAQAERAESAFTNLVGGVHAATRMLNELKEATRGTRSEAELMESATNLMALGLGKTSEDISSIMQNVEALGARFGGTMQIFQLMMSNQSLARIDSFGIGIAEATERIDAFKASGMGAEEAFNVAILELMGEKFEQLGGQVDDAVSANMRLQASWQDLKAEVGKGLAPAVADVIESLAGLAATMNETSSRADAGQAMFGDRYTKALREVQRGSYAAAQELKEMNGAIDALNTASERATRQAEYYIGIQKSTNTVVSKGAGVWGEYDLNMRLAAQGALEASGAAAQVRNEMLKAEELARATDGWNMVKEAMGGAIGKAAESYIANAGQIRDSMEEIRGKVYNLRVEQEKLPESSQRYIDITKEIGGLEEEYSGLIVKLGELGAAHEEANKRALLGMLEQRMALDGLSTDEQDALTQLAGTWGLIDEATLRALQGTAEAVDKFQDGTTTVDELGAELLDLIAAVDPAAGALENAAGVADTASVNMGDAAQAARDLRAGLDELESKTIDLTVNWNVPEFPSVTLPGGQQITMMANGFEGVFTRPTLAMFGEAGPEYVHAVPQNQMSTVNNNVSGGNIYINNNAQAAMVMERRARMRSLGRSF